MDNHNNEQQIRELYNALLEQWNKRNAPGFAGLFMPDGNMIGFDGSQLNGQKEIHSVFKDIFEDFPTARYITIIKEIRALTEGSALLIAVAGMVPQGQDDISPAVNVLHTLVAVKIEDQWRIALFQNTPASFHGRPEMAEQLTEDLRRAWHISSAN